MADHMEAELYLLPPPPQRNSGKVFMLLFFFQCLQWDYVTLQSRTMVTMGNHGAIMQYPCCFLERVVNKQLVVG